MDLLRKSYTSVALRGAGGKLRSSFPTVVSEISAKTAKPKEPHRTLAKKILNPLYYILRTILRMQPLGYGVIVLYT